MERFIPTGNLFAVFCKSVTTGGLMTRLSQCGRERPKNIDAMSCARTVRRAIYVSPASPQMIAVSTGGYRRRAVEA